MDHRAEIDVKVLRGRLGWSQAQLGEYLGIDQATVSRIENGSRPSGPVLRLLAALEQTEAAA